MHLSTIIIGDVVSLARRMVSQRVLRNEFSYTHHQETQVLISLSV
jgi:hypothetical protein